jgi:hypothetical protein
MLEQRLTLMSAPPRNAGAADRPVDRSGRDSERALEIVDELQRIARGAVELVDERENRQPVSRQPRTTRVWSSTPFAASMTITTLSAARGGACLR